MLASCIPPSKGNDDALFQCMRAHGVKPVINVYNELIRKYCRKPGAKVHMKGSRSQVMVVVYQLNPILHHRLWDENYTHMYIKCFLKEKTHEEPCILC